MEGFEGAFRWEYEGAFGSFMATTAALSAASFYSGDSTLTMLVDSGATHNFVDLLITPWVQDMMGDYCVLDVPHTIVATGQHVLQGVDTGIVQGTVIDEWARKKFLFPSCCSARNGSQTCSLSPRQCGR